MAREGFHFISPHKYIHHWLEVDDTLIKGGYFKNSDEPTIV